MGTLFAPSAWVWTESPGAETDRSQSLRFYIGDLTSPCRTSGRPDLDGKVPDSYSELYGLLGPCKRTQ